jgi:hypothetical protein
VNTPDLKNLKAGLTLIATRTGPFWTMALMDLLAKLLTLL